MEAPHAHILKQFELDDAVLQQSRCRFCIDAKHLRGQSINSLFPTIEHAQSQNVLSTLGTFRPMHRYPDRQRIHKFRNAS